MAAVTVEGLLENLISQSNKQDSKFLAETKKAAARHEELVTRDVTQDKSDAKRDKFAMQQQGQEVQLSKKTQHHTWTTQKLTKTGVESQEQLSMGPGNQPKWDKTSSVMTSEDASQLEETQTGIGIESEKRALEQQASLDTLAAHAEETMSYEKWWATQMEIQDRDRLKNFEIDHKTKKQDTKILEDIKEDQKEGLWHTLKRGKETFDKNRLDQASMGNMVGAIKTDASLIFGSMGALTALPGVQTVMTASKFLLSNIYLLLVHSLVPWLGSSLKAFGKGFLNLGKTFGGWFKKTNAFNKARVKAQNIMELRGLKGEKLERRLGLMRQGRDKKGRFTGKFERTGMGKVVSGMMLGLSKLMKPFGFILKMLNPFRKIMLVAVLVIGGLFSLFKSAGGTKEGFFNKMSEYWTAIKSFFTDTLLPMFKKLYENILLPLWDIFLNDIMPLLGWIFDKVVVPLGKVIWEIAKLLGKVVALIFKYYGWIYDKIFRPLLKAFDIVESDPDQMDARGLQVEKDALLRDKENQGFFRRWNPEKQAKLDDIKARIAAGQGATSGSEISGLNGEISDLSNQPPGLGGGGNINTASNNSFYSGNKSIYSNTGSGNLSGYAFQGSNSID